MKSVKISETANLVVVKLSEKFRMSKQAFVSLILENIVVDDVVKLQARDIIGDGYEIVRHNGYGKNFPETDVSEDEVYDDDEDDVEIEFEEEDESVKEEIEGL